LPRESTPHLVQRGVIDHEVRRPVAPHRRVTSARDAKLAVLQDAVAMPMSRVKRRTVPSSGLRQVPPVSTATGIKSYKERVSTKREALTLKLLKGCQNLLGFFSIQGYSVHWKLKLEIEGSELRS
jgi:hypothetical protein